MYPERSIIRAVLITAALFGFGVFAFRVLSPEGQSPAEAPPPVSTPSVEISPVLPALAHDDRATAVAEAPTSPMLRIAVLDLLGRSIEGASVVLARDEDDREFRFEQANGQSDQSAAMDHGLWQWRAEAPGHQADSGEFDFRPDNAALTIFLDPVNPPLRGIVVDGGDKPLAGITINASDASTNEAIGRAESGADGRFMFLAMPAAGVVRLTPIESGRAREPELIPFPVEGEIKLRVIPDGIITGALLDAGGRLGVEPELIRFEGLDPPDAPKPTAWTNLGGGQFKIQTRPGQFRIQIDAADGFVRLNSVTVSPGQTLDLGELRLDPGGATLEAAVVRGEPPEPLAGVAVSLTQLSDFAHHAAMARTVTGETDASGLFRAGGLPPGHYSLSLTREYPLRRELQFSNGEQKNLTIAMPVPGEVEGRVLAGAELKPVANALIEFRPQELDDGTGSGGASSLRVLTTGPNGEFVINGVWPHNPFQFQVKAEGWAARRVEITPAKEHEWIEVILTSEGAELRGRVVDQQNEGLKAKVVLRSGGFNRDVVDSLVRESWQSHCGDDGRFTFESVPLDQPLTITASLDGYESVSVPLNGAPKDPFLITMRAGRGLRLRVVHADRSPVNGLVEVSRAAAPDSPLLFKGEILDGRLDFGAFGYFGELIAFRHKNERACRVFHPGSGDTVEESVILSPSARLMVSVLGPDSAAVVGASVLVANRQGEAMNERRSTDVSGEAAFDVLPGEYLVTASHPEFVARRERVVIGEGARKDVTIRFESGPRLEIQIVDAESGFGIAQAPVTLLSDQGVTLVETVSDDAGVAGFQAIPPGGYRAQVLLGPGVLIEQGGILFDDAKQDNQRLLIRIPRLINVALRFLRAGEPVAGSAVRLDFLTPVPGLAPGQSIRAVLPTNARGEVHWAVPAAGYYLVLNPPEFNETITITEADEGREFEFNLTDHLVTVKAIDEETRKPVMNAEVALIMKSAEDQTDESGWYQSTDAAGQAVFTPPYDGEFRLVVVPPKSYDEWESEPFALTDGHSRQFIEAPLKKSSLPPGTLILRMVDDITQQPIKETISNFLLFDFNLGAWADYVPPFTLPSEGVVRFTDFQPGHYWAQLISPNYLSEKIEFVFSEDAGLVFNLRGARHASARVTVQNAPEHFDPEAAFILYLFDPIDRAERKDSLWALPDKPCGPFLPGLYYYQFELPDAGLFDGLVELLPGEVADIPIDLNAPPDATPDP